MPGFLKRAAELFGGGREGCEAEAHAKDDERALEQARERFLSGQRCPGCTRSCPLARPRCAHGFEVQAKRLAAAGLRRTPTGG